MATPVVQSVLNRAVPLASALEMNFWTGRCRLLQRVRAVLDKPDAEDNVETVWTGASEENPTYRQAMSSG